MNFQAIRNARKAAGVTQEQLAEVLGINRATLSKYETGVIEPSVSQLKTIAAALRIDFYVLANEIGNEWFDAGFEGFSFAFAGVSKSEKQPFEATFLTACKSKCMSKHY